MGKRGSRKGKKKEEGEDDEEEKKVSSRNKCLIFQRWRGGGREVDAALP